MKEGTISEQGSHEELISNDKEYNHLISLGQAQNGVKDEDNNTEKDKNAKISDKMSFENTENSLGPTQEIKSKIDEEEINQLNVDEGDILNYSSWGVLLEYFKVSYNNCLQNFHFIISWKYHLMNLFETVNYFFLPW